MISLKFIQKQKTNKQKQNKQKQNKTKQKKKKQKTFSNKFYNSLFRQGSYSGHQKSILVTMASAMPTSFQVWIMIIIMCLVNILSFHNLPMIFMDICNVWR